MIKGTVLWYNKYKGFGLVESDFGEAIFVHKSHIQEGSEHLKPGDRVEFAMYEREDRKDYIGREVKLI